MIGSSRVVAVVPARAGSKGVPRKNLRKLGGIPLFAHSVRAAMESLYIDECFVSSNDLGILQQGSLYGAIPHERPDEFSGDHSTAVEVVRDFANAHHELLGAEDILVYLQPTSPFRTAKHIDAALRLLSKGTAESIVSVLDQPVFYAKLVSIETTGLLMSVLGSAAATKNRQDLRSLWQPNGAIYAFRMRKFWRSGSIPIDDSLPYWMSEIESLDVDSEHHFDLAEFYLRRNNA